MKDKTDPIFWHKVKVGQTVELRDLLSLKDALERNKATSEMFYTIWSIRTIKEISGICEWYIFNLRDSDEIRDLMLLVKIVDSQLETRIYYQAPDEHVIPGSRIDLMNSWIFEAPPPFGSIDLGALEYVDQFDRTYEDGTDVFVKKGGIEYQGLSQITPRSSGLDDELLATVVEYQANTDHDDNQALILELGEEGDDGGFITLYWGSVTSLNDLDVIGR